MHCLLCAILSFLFETTHKLNIPQQPSLSWWPNLILVESLILILGGSAILIMKALADYVLEFLA